MAEEVSIPVEALKKIAELSKSREGRSDAPHWNLGDIARAALKREAKRLWEQFSDIPINDADEIQTPFLQFLLGTDRFLIWHWFEDTYNVSVAKDLMGSGWALQKPQGVIINPPVIVPAFRYPIIENNRSEE
jgi:hypothetical protein